MKIARFLMAGRPAVGVNGGAGYLDYVAILDARGYGSDIKGADPERRLVRMLKHGLLDEAFIKEQLDWALHSGYDFWLRSEGVTPLLPHRPAKIICLARNYRDHAKEGGGTVPEAPIFFAKTDNCAIGCGQAIRIPMDIGRVEHEGELGVVISRRAQGVKAGDADSVILGYTIVNDVTARELQKSLGARGLPWFQAKSRDAFAPIGPAIVTREEFGDPYSSRIKVTVNGETRQDASIADMVWKIPELIEAVTAVVTLLPGDIISTGTPAGVGALKPGDSVTVEIEGIGKLVNPVEGI